MRVLRLMASLAVACGAFAIVTAGAGASSADHPAVCTGTFTSPGVLAGNYHSDVVVQGVCAVNGGATRIDGNLIVASGAALNATFALDDQPGGSGPSNLSVGGNVLVQSGGTLALGCEPNASPCTDDPAGSTGGTLTSTDHIHGNLVSTQSLGVLVHAATIDGNVLEAGGGGGAFSGPGANCTPIGIFADIGSPVFSDYEDDNIGGSLVVTGLQTCWLGALRDNIGGTLIDSNNTMADPDANEVVQNTVRGSMVCLGDSPAVQFGDSGASPNVVGGFALGECAFGVTSPDPNYGTGGPQPVSVPAGHRHH
jgi:hypothetical protein